MVGSCHHAPVEERRSPWELRSSRPAPRRNTGAQAVLLDLRRGIILCSVRYLHTEGLLLGSDQR